MPVCFIDALGLDVLTGACFWWSSCRNLHDKQKRFFVVPSDERISTRLTSSWSMPFSPRLLVLLLKVRKHQEKSYSLVRCYQVQWCIA